MFVTRFTKLYKLLLASVFFCNFPSLFFSSFYLQSAFKIHFIHLRNQESYPLYGSLLEHHYAIKNINNRLKKKNTKKERIIGLLLYKRRLLNRLTKSTSSGNNMDNHGAIHCCCLDCYWSIIMWERNKLII